MTVLLDHSITSTSSTSLCTTKRCIRVSYTQPRTKWYHTALPIHYQLLLFSLSIVLPQASSYCTHLRTWTLKDTELCEFLGAGIFTMIVSVHFHDNQGSKSGVKYDYQLMHNNIVLHESVDKKWDFNPHKISSGQRNFLQNTENQHLYVLTTTMSSRSWMYQYRGVSIVIYIDYYPPTPLHSA